MQKHRNWDFIAWIILINWQKQIFSPTITGTIEEQIRRPPKVNVAGLMSSKKKNIQQFLLISNPPAMTTTNEAYAIKKHQYQPIRNRINIAIQLPTFPYHCKRKPQTNTWARDEQNVYPIKDANIQLFSTRQLNKTVAYTFSSIMSEHHLSNRPKT